ncbi:zinc-binding dehydrogenase [Mesorhizobium sp. B2-6-6]
MDSRLCRDQKVVCNFLSNEQSDKIFHTSVAAFSTLPLPAGAASLAPGVLAGTAAKIAALAEASQPTSSQAVDASASTIATRLPSPTPFYLSFGRNEAGFVEVTANVMFPAEALIPRPLTIAGPAGARPTNGLAVDFVVESNRDQLNEIVQRVRDGRLRTNIDKVVTLDEAIAAFNVTERRKGKTIIRIRP